MLKTQWNKKLDRQKKRAMKFEWKNNEGKKFDGIYFGEMEEQLPNGIGRWTGYNGTIVEGEWM